MSIVPMSRLSPADAALLGTNVTSARRGGTARRPRRKGHLPLVAAVNRSLAGVGEQVRRLYAR